jgi:hypothetical protein
VSAAHQRVAWEILGLTSDEKLLLLAFARHACEHCGLCWPGRTRLQLLTNLGSTSLTGLIRSLVKREMLKIHAYPNGGRGLATEFVVLPKELKLSTAPCGKCVDNLKTSRRAAGFSDET